MIQCIQKTQNVNQYKQQGAGAQVPRILYGGAFNVIIICQGSFTCGETIVHMPQCGSRFNSNKTMLTISN